MNAGQRVLPHVVAASGFWWTTQSVAAVGILFGSTVVSQADSNVNGTPSAGNATPNEFQLNGQTNHPLDFEAVTNENTAKMTLAKKAGMEAYTAGRFAEAEKRFREAVAEAKLGFGADDPHVAACMNNLAEFYRNTRQFEKAEQLYRQALHHLQELYGEKHWLYVAALHNLALMFDAKGAHEMAEETFQKVLQLRLSMFGPKHYLYADTMFALANTLKKLGGRDGEVVELMRKSVDVLEESGNVEATAVLYWLMELCKALEDSQQYQAAVEYLRKAVGYLAADQGEIQAQASEFADMLVAALEKLGDLGEAVEQQRKCVQARMALFGHHPLVARSMSKLASLEVMTGPEGRASAERWVDMALQICDDIWQRSTGMSVQGWFNSSTKVARCQERLQSGLEFCRTVLLLSQLDQLAAEAQQRQAATAGASASGSSGGGGGSAAGRGWRFWRKSSSGSAGDATTGSSSSSKSSSGSDGIESSRSAGSAGSSSGSSSEPPQQPSAASAPEPERLSRLLQLAISRLEESSEAAKQLLDVGNAKVLQGSRLPDLYVDAQLALVESLEALVTQLRQQGGAGSAAEAAKLEASAEKVAAALFSSL